MTTDERKARNREYSRRWRERNPDKHRERTRVYREKNREQYAALARKRHADKRAWMDSLKNAPCVRCSQQFPPVAMDWHHRDPSTKVFDIGPNVGRSREAILIEIEKCDLLCAVCHRLVEAGL